ncbi:MAG TPA: NAD-dependent succinate-semialdehyde dehydrogenase [Thiotrichales bacterium]|nr:NAD-dependent succinate-semialdehyde dehydrogenase [Thiotrichales bacterium]
MSIQSVSPLDGTVLRRFEPWDDARLEETLQAVWEASLNWRQETMKNRCHLLRQVAEVLRARREEYARLITLEMGKRIDESRAEVEKCAWVCDFYAEKAPEFLTPRLVSSDAGRSYVTCQPLGPVLAVMPWNFPFWQVMRFAAPAIAAGNVALLKHASNVPQCALALEELFVHAGAPDDLFRTLLVPASRVEAVIADRRVAAVTLTGSEPAGRAVAAAAGRHLKKTVLELGGSDPFIVLEDADLDHTVEAAVTSRFLNGGQSCIAAKRFILVGEVAEPFLERFRERVEALRPGDPMDPATTLPPLARHDLRDELHRQVTESLANGAVAVTGCAPLEGPGAFYQASILDRVAPGMPAWEEELFGPVAIVIRAGDEAEALRIANGSRFGLGGSVWTADCRRGERLALDLECGCAFVNGIVKSDPRLPFGGVKASGYGRELSVEGIREFVNVKTVWLA